MKDSRGYAILMTILAALLWSSGGLFIKLLPQDAFTILFYRSFYAALIFLPFFGKKLFVFNKLSIISSLFYAPLLITFVTSTKIDHGSKCHISTIYCPSICSIIGTLFCPNQTQKN
jgi:drug/metabolite transporter, DME family